MAGLGEGAACHVELVMRSVQSMRGVRIMRRPSQCGRATAAQLCAIRANYSEKKKLYGMTNKQPLCLSSITKSLRYMRVITNDGEEGVI